VFYGTFPSGNGINGSDFVAELDAYHDKVFAPQTIVGTSSAANGGAGGSPVGFVHSGVFSPAIPRGGSPVFGTTSASADRRLAAIEAHSSAKSRRVGQHATSRAVAKQTRIRDNGTDVKTRSASHPHGPLHS
jgi:hypothetical protein